MNVFHTKSQVVSKMKSLGLVLEPYKELISKTAAFITYGHQLSGVFVCYNIKQQRSTDGYSMFPFLSGFVMATLGYLFGSITADASTMQSNSIAAAINIAYISIYLFYANTKHRDEAWRQISSGLVILVVILAYTMAENPTALPFRLRLIQTTLMLLPFLGLREIIQKKCTDGVPFLLTLSATLISLLWLLYGIATEATYSIIQNGLICTLNTIQLTLFAIFPPKQMKEPSENANQDNKLTLEINEPKLKVKKPKTPRTSVAYRTSHRKSQ